MIDYAAMKKEYPRLLAALTRAKNSKDPKKVLAAVQKAYDRFDVIGWPDRWHIWESARNDAESAARRNAPYVTFAGG